MRAFFGQFGGDVRQACRSIVAAPIVAAVIVGSLGVGIGVNTTVFSWIDGLLLHPFPGAANSDELAILEMITAGAPQGGTSISWPDYRDYRDRTRSLSGIALHRQVALTLGDVQTTRLAWGELVSANQ